MAQASTIVPRGQTVLPPEVHEYVKGLYKAKGEVTPFAKRAGINLDTLRLAMLRGTTTDKTLAKIKNAMLQKSGVPVVTNGNRLAPVRSAAAKNGHAEPVIEQLPPAVLRQVQRVSSALLDGMQLMQLTVLKAIQEELTELHRPPRNGS